MAAIFAKTPEGQKEVTARSLGLPARARTLLILVDGKRSSTELAALVPEVDTLLDVLLKAGLIAPAGGSPSLPPERPPGPEAAATVPARDVAQLRRDAARAINDLLGPDGDSLAMRIEAAATADELRAALGRAVAFIADVRGRPAAEDFARRFLG